MRFKTAAMHGALGALGGVIAYGIDWGTAYVPVAPMWQTVIFGAAGAVGSIGVSMLADDRVGSGIAGGTAFGLAGRIREQIALAGVAKKGANDAGAVYMREGGAVYRMNAGRHAPRDAGAVYRREAGALVGGAAATTMRAPAFGRSFKDAGAMYAQRTGAETMRQPGFGTSFKDEAGASRYIPGPVRWYGPHSWAYKYGDAGRYRSAHSRTV